MEQETFEYNQIENEKARHFSNFKSGVSWYFWLAVISAVNLIIQFTSSNTENPIRFAVGLSISKYLTLYPLKIFPNLSPMTIPTVIAVIFIAILVLLGLMAQRRNKNAYIAGMVIYALDIIPAILMKDIYSVVFHLIVLGFLIWGFVNLIKLEKLEAEYPDPEESQVIVVGSEND